MELKHVYKTLLCFYPADYRAAFATEILHILDESARERRKQRPIRFAVAEIAGLLIGTASEWASKLTSDPAVRGRSLPDLRIMRPVGVPKNIWFAERPQQIPHSTDACPRTSPAPG